MKIEIAQVTLATKDVQGTRDFYAALLGDEVRIEDFEFYYTLADGAQPGCTAVVPHNGDPMWDRPWITFATDDFPQALKRLEAIGAQDVQNSGPTDEDGNPIACVTFRDPDGRLLMLATK